MQSGSSSEESGISGINVPAASSDEVDANNLAQYTDYELKEFKRKGEITRQEFEKEMAKREENV